MTRLFFHSNSNSSTLEVNYQENCCICGVLLHKLHGGCSVSDLFRNIANICNSIWYLLHYSSLYFSVQSSHLNVVLEGSSNRSLCLHDELFTLRVLHWKGESYIFHVFTFILVFGSDRNRYMPINLQRSGNNIWETCWGTPKGKSGITWVIETKRISLYQEVSEWRCS